MVELGDSSVNFVVRPWVKASDYWGVHMETIEKIKKAFDANGINIPYPQRDVHLYQHTVTE
jgi:small conductance mechanosensitive channel